MSSTIGSPAAITRSDASWWGEAEFGPDPTIAKCASSWPSAMSRSRTSRATSASVRPTSRPPAIWATTRSAAWAASVSNAISSSSLTIRRRPRIGEASSKVAPASRSWRRRRCRAGRSSETAIRSGTRSRAVAHHRRDQRVRVVRLVPGHDRQQAGGGRRAGSGGRRLESRHDEGPVPRRGDDQHRQTFQRHGRIAGQVAHVRPDPDEDRAEAGLAGQVPGRRDPVPVALGRDGGSGRGHVAGSRIPLSVIQ